MYVLDYIIMVTKGHLRSPHFLLMFLIFLPHSSLISLDTNITRAREAEVVPLTPSLLLDLELLHLPRHLLLAPGHGVGHDLQPAPRELVPGHGPG